MIIDLIGFVVYSYAFFWILASIGNYFSRKRDKEIKELKGEVEVLRRKPPDNEIYIKHLINRNKELKRQIDFKTEGFNMLSDQIDFYIDVIKELKEK
jgi:hypothetical protein